MSHASVMVGLINRIIYKRIIIRTVTGESVENCGCSEWRGVGVPGSEASGVAGSRNRTPRHQPHFEIYLKVFSALGGVTGSSATATAFPCPLALVATARALDLSSLYPCRSPLFLRLCPRRCLICLLCLPSFLLFGLHHHCNAIDNSGFRNLEVWLVMRS
jgi:hypothetical protein